MSLSENAVFAYESSVHSTNVLLSLNEQRKKDVLCDATVFVEGQRFRAHRSVLAACSSYFHSRIVGQADAELNITLPEEVTVKGFEPLIQFAYTAKLILSKDNVDEVCKCVEFLSVHNIEESCFQFLKYKFLDSTADQQECPRKKCFPSHCQKTDLKFSLSDQKDLEIDEVEEFLEDKNVQTPHCKLQRYQENVKTSPPLQDSASQTCESMCMEKNAALALPSLCPKYRKFQKAFGTDRGRAVESGIKDVQASSVQSSETSENECLGSVQDCADLQVILKCEESKLPVEETAKKKEPAFQVSTEKAEGTAFPHSSADPHGLYSLSLLHTYDQYSDLSFAGMQGAAVKTEKPLSGTGVPEEKAFAESQDLPLKDDSGPKEDGSLASSDRSSVEREVAEHLAKGFWSDICSTDSPCQMQLSPAVAKDGSEQIYSQKRSECPWLGIRISESPEPGQRTFTTLSSVNCPFMSTLSTEGCPSNLEIGNDSYVSEQQEPCPYACVISLGDDSETDTEGDSESCSAREQECEVKLPFNAQRIISLSRNDFQSLLKMHKLTPEQLDCIHDIRRRSKNRIAAQRCRKRKLDCIQNLESEIEKLQNEKENLLKERDHILSTLGETKQNLTGLCQQVCEEAALSQEQIQILAKYSASDCPLSFLISEKGKSTSDGELLLRSIFSLSDWPPAAPSPGGRGGCEPGCTAGQEAQPAPAAVSEPAGPVEQCRQSGGISDFCQQMTDKCTTDE
ncbi:PREDICTED: transcription regulator protein BACH1 [Chinchilla lanigera]|uniref:BTB domain and CNC homolog 1 n=1 Tax=Chinchilla lanigera TaxID=34839 RepID=A0A8C2YM05_CHILA|nr:PREDICTED: transcription regulator protein BACH1 [Chinchilla lanigera]